METKAKGSREQRYTDAQYIQGLKDGDAKVTHSFFYNLCNYTINDVRISLMHCQIGYDELVNELFIYLSANNWSKLNTFSGFNGCSLMSWMVKLTWRFFMQRRESILGKHDSLDTYAETIDGKVVSLLDLEIAMDVESTFRRMANKRYVQVLTWMLVEGYSAEEVAERLQTSVANVYNIKHRAIVQFIETYSR